MSKKANTRKPANKKNNSHNKTDNHSHNNQKIITDINKDDVMDIETVSRKKEIIIDKKPDVNLSVDDIEDKVIIEKETSSILNDVKANKFLWSILAVLFCILIIALIITNAGDKASDKEEPTTTIEEETSTKEEETTEKGEVLPEAENSPYVELINNYLKASRIDVSMEEVEKYVDNTENMSLADNEILKKYIEEYQNLECYVLDSSKSNTYVVVATYGCKFHNIETAAPGCEAFIVVDKDGKYLVHNLTLQETIDTYISNNIDRKTINSIMDDINSSLEEALNNDEELKKVINVIIGED